MKSLLLKIAVNKTSIIVANKAVKSPVIRPIIIESFSLSSVFVPFNFF